MADVLRRDHSPVMAEAAVLPDHHLVKVRAGVLPDHSRVMAPAAALQGSRAAVGALRDHHPVMAAEGAMAVAAMAAEEVTAVAATAAAEVTAVAATAVATTSSRTVSRSLSPASGNGAALRRQQHAGDDRNLTDSASPAPKPPALKNHRPDQAPASTGA
jgi:hypothetical protein